MNHRSVPIDLADLLEVIVDAVIVVDQEQRVVYFNDGAEAIFGYARDEIVGRSLTMLIPPRYSETHHKHIHRFGQGSDVSRPMGARTPISGLRKGGVEFPAEAAITKLKRGDQWLFAVFLRDITERMKMEQELRERAEQMAVVNERNRLARDLHDAVTQTLFSASLLSDVIPRIWERNPAEARRRLEELRQLSRGALAEMRTLLLELRPTALVESKLGDLLRQLAVAMNSRSRVQCELHIDDGDLATLPADIKVSLYRIAQEALNNVAKHSGATQAWLMLEPRPNTNGASDGRGVSLVIRDNGKGFSIESTRGNQLGLRIMRERADAIGAQIAVQSALGEGTTVTTVWEPHEQYRND